MKIAYNKRMQPDIFTRYAPENAADAKRYKAPVGNK
jgi:hypothetical protein